MEESSASTSIFNRFPADLADYRRIRAEFICASPTAPDLSGCAFCGPRFASPKDFFVDLLGIGNYGLKQLKQSTQSNYLPNQYTQKAPAFGQGLVLSKVTLNYAVTFPFTFAITSSAMLLGAGA